MWRKYSVFIFLTNRQSMNILNKFIQSFELWRNFCSEIASYE